jgi:hypothetical protein
VPRRIGPATTLACDPRDLPVDALQIVFESLKLAGCGGPARGWRRRGRLGLRRCRRCSLGGRARRGLAGGAALVLDLRSIGRDAPGARERTLSLHGRRRRAMPKSRAERDRGRGETPSKRALRGAQKTARQDPERGVTSRARKRRQGHEDVPDPRYGGRPGQEKSKWRPPAELMTPRQRRLARKKH